MVSRKVMERPPIVPASCARLSTMARELEQIAAQPAILSHLRRIQAWRRVRLQRLLSDPNIARKDPGRHRSIEPRSINIAVLNACGSRPARLDRPLGICRVDERSCYERFGGR